MKEITQARTKVGGGRHYALHRERGETLEGEKFTPEVDRNLLGPSASHMGRGQESKVLLTPSGGEV